MAYTGLHTVLFSAPDMKKSRKFFADWGLRKVSDDKKGAVFETQVGSRVIIRPPSAKNMPPPAKEGMNFREMIWVCPPKSISEKFIRNWRRTFRQHLLLV